MKLYSKDPSLNALIVVVVFLCGLVGFGSFQHVTSDECCQPQDLAYESGFAIGCKKAQRAAGPIPTTADPIDRAYADEYIYGYAVGVDICSDKTLSPSDILNAKHFRENENEN